MSRSVNKVTLIGTVGRDPEMRFTPGGSAIANFSMATNESYNDKNTGQRVENTEWHRLVAFGKLAEIIQQYVKKGGKLYVEGKLRTSEWEKDGIKRYSTDIIINEMVMLDRAPASGDNAGFAGQQQGQANNPYGAGAYQGGPAAYPNQAAPAPQAQPQAQGYQQPGGYPQQNPGAYNPGQAPQYQPPAQPQNPMQQTPAAHQQAPQQQPAPQAQPQPSNQFDGPEDDIPF